MEFRILGPLEVYDGGRAVPISSPRIRTVLGLLIARPAQVISVDQFVDELWPERVPRDARAVVYSFISRLRRDLQTAPDIARRLVTRKPGYTLEVAEQDLDVYRFEQLVNEARALRLSKVQRSVQVFQQAQGLWRGQPFGDVPPTRSIDEISARLLERRLIVLEEQFDTAIQAGQDAELVADLSELVRAHPLRERLVGLLMVALARAGRTADALYVYHQAKERLAEELGIDPDPELRRLELGILRADADLGRPAGGLIHHNRQSPAQLPADPSPFAGRITEIRELLTLTPQSVGGHPGSSGAVVIDGMAGVGKTALAVHAAHQLAERFPGGQLFMDLHGFTPAVTPVEPNDALQSILLALGTPADRLPDQLDARAALYRSRLADARVLVLLDNAYDEGQVRPLLPGSGDNLVLITSRRRLPGLDQAQSITLDVLTRPDAVTLFNRAARLDLIANESQADIIDVVELCGRLPLAVRIAAVRLRHRPAWTVGDVAERLRGRHRRLDELESGQRGVMSALDLSYADLDVDHQRMYQLLAMHPGVDIDIYATAALIGTTPAEAERALEALLDAHLIQERQAGRFQFHNLVRDHAASIAGRAPADHRALARLLDHYVHTASVATDLLRGHNSDRDTTPQAQPSTTAPLLSRSVDAASWLDTELANLLATARCGANSRLDAGYARRLSATLDLYLLTHAHYGTAVALHNQALSDVRDTGDRWSEASVLVRLGVIYRMQRRYRLANRCLVEGLDLAREINNSDCELRALIGLGSVQRMQGVLAAADDCYAQALSLARRINSQVGEHEALYGLGHSHRMQGQYAAAANCYQRAIDVARNIHHQVGEVHSLIGLAEVRSIQGWHGSANPSSHRALDIARAIDYRIGELAALIGLGHVHHGQNEYGLASRCFHDALEIAHEVDDRNYQFEVLYRLARCQYSAGDTDRALTHFRDALHLADELEQHQSRVRAHNGLAHAHEALHQHRQAREHWQSALAILTKLGLRKIEDIDAEQLRDRITAA